MIKSVTIGWRKAGRTVRSKEFAVSGTASEKIAFAQAVEKLKIEMIQASAREYGPDSAHFIAQVAEVLSLQPWAVKYERPGDKLGNVEAQEGCDRCSCGCKYWENDRCIDCGKSVEKAVNRLIGTRCECGAPYDPEFGGYACAK